eukprot:TRINITY_DN45271_c0_g2_i1.p1 TRINITY_DN45271_c0_g2~~TRINITY_DN45271_c0_g2_i1.p1  ORF type:complete len:284 (+),score=60.15 TRINITY_DN45271_c0_g2_i1:97-948(+)
MSASAAMAYKWSRSPLAGGDDDPGELLEAATVGLALAGASGLRCSVPLFIVSLYALEHHGAVSVGALDCIGTAWFTGLMGGLVLIEVLADKVPFLDHALHAILCLGAPVAGAIVSCPRNAPVFFQCLAMAAGALLAGAVHALRATVRGASSASTMALGNVCLSLTEDVVIVLLVPSIIATAGVALVVTVAFACVVALSSVAVTCKKCKKRSQPAASRPGHERPEGLAEPLMAQQAFLDSTGRAPGAAQAFYMPPPTAPAAASVSAREVPADEHEQADAVGSAV